MKTTKELYPIQITNEKHEKVRRKIATDENVSVELLVNDLKIGNDVRYFNHRFKSTKRKLYV